MLKQIDSDPFVEYPELLDIWPHRRFEIIRDLKDCLEHPELERMFLVIYDNKPIGITGYYQYDDQVGLNWHGVLKEHNGHGYGLAALRDLIPLAVAHYPNAMYLVEEIPANLEHKLGGFFLRAGFIKTNTLVDKPWITSDTDWIEYHLPLK